MSDKLPEKTLPTILATETAAKSRLFEVQSVSLQFSNGEQRLYERMKSSGRGAVMIVAMPDPETILLVREYAAGTHDYQLGLPKGLIDPGESASEAANRELKEEVGFGANTLTQLKSLCLAPGYFGGTMHILLAQDLYPEQLIGDEPEPLDVVPWSIHQLDELLARDDFSEARSVAAIFLARRHLNLAT
ncbi:ADP compounds hydrolase NudE [Saccharobesus litoralis]|uniref:ADP compounds hydrolase NudE n=1 Tax=Saccharobesus litoralis TaxID=2172099 RepID=A0A2S0VWR9_9ALTE|nr:ADP compounds hydrolase NudE [Saccharobesus litoralis]AWB68666.1 ADP compounds hydrolase NudE [Saccharobesus litoralis]